MGTGGYKITDQGAMYFPAATLETLKLATEQNYYTPLTLVCFKLKGIAVRMSLTTDNYLNSYI